MFKKHPSPITDENFPEVWDYADRKLRSLKAAAAANTAACWIGNLLFCFCCFVGMYGILTAQESSGFRAYLSSITFLKTAWDAANAFIFDPNNPGMLQVAYYFLCLYGIPFAGAAVVTLLVRAVYHPRKNPLPTGTPNENAKYLREMTQRIRNRSQKIRSGNNAAYVFNALYLFLFFILVSCYIVTLSDVLDPQAAQNLARELNTLSLTFVSMAVFCFYAVVNYIFIQMLIPLSYVYVPYDLIADSENYRLESDPEEKARLEEEERILALAKQIMERRKTEEERLRSL